MLMSRLQMLTLTAVALQTRAENVEVAVFPKIVVVAVVPT
jgi:hypothetical protein